MKRIPKVGDKYKCVAEGWNAPVGTIITITGVDSDDCYRGVSYSYGGSNGLWGVTLYPNDFEYIPETQQFEGRHFINVKAYAEKYNITLKKAHKEIQPKLFELGYVWPNGDAYVKFKQSNFLCLNETRQKELRWFDNEGEDEATNEIIIEREEVVTLKLSVKEAPKEYVEFNGKQYEKAKIEQALKLIEGDE